MTEAEIQACLKAAADVMQGKPLAWAVVVQDPVTGTVHRAHNVELEETPRFLRYVADTIESVPGRNAVHNYRGPKN